MNSQQLEELRHGQQCIFCGEIITGDNSAERNQKMFDHQMNHPKLKKAMEELYGKE